MTRFFKEAWEKVAKHVKRKSNHENKITSANQLCCFGQVEAKTSQI